MSDDRKGIIDALDRFGKREYARGYDEGHTNGYDSAMMQAALDLEIPQSLAFGLGVIAGAILAYGIDLIIGAFS